MTAEFHGEGREDGEQEGGFGSASPQEGLLAALGRQWGSAPWYVSSFAVHLLVLVLMLLLAPAPKTQTSNIPVIIAELPPEVETPVDPTPAPPVDLPVDDPKPDITVTQDIKIPEITPDIVIAPIDDTENDIKDNTQMDNSAAYEGGPNVMAIHSSTGPRGPKNSAADIRKGPGVKKILDGHKIPREVLTSLDDGLAWLARTQEHDGHWDCIRYEGRPNDVAVSALAQLAFLACGNSSRVGKYRTNVKRSQEYLLTNRDELSGRIGKYRYEAAITMMAMAESWMMSEDRRLAPIVQAQVDDAQKFQNANGGWGYTPEADAVKAHVDTSVAGWWMMGMKSAKMAGADVAEQSWDKARSYFTSVTQENKGGYVTSGYVGKGGTANMTAVGLTCLQFLGLGRNDPLVKGQAEYFMKHPEEMVNPRNNLANPFYGWYYQAMGMYQMGGDSEYWKKFGPQLYGVMLSLQEKSGPDKGSWAPKVPWQNRVSHFEEQVGRVGTTAIACLTLACYREGKADDLWNGKR